MPSNYAHHHFGNCVWRSMPPKLRQYAQADRALFAIGQHGPDILFYYMAMGHNPVNSVGYDTHDRTGTDFFTCAARAWESAGQPPGDDGVSLGSGLSLYPGCSLSRVCGEENPGQRREPHQN